MILGGADSQIVNVPCLDVVILSGITWQIHNASFTWGDRKTHLKTFKDLIPCFRPDEPPCYIVLWHIFPWNNPPWNCFLSDDPPHDRITGLALGYWNGLSGAQWFCTIVTVLPNAEIGQFVSASRTVMPNMS